jgi:phosphate acyltransferase
MPMQIKIGIDMMGGDFAPLEAVKGLSKFYFDDVNGNVTVFAFGDEAILKPLFVEHNIPDSVRIIHAPEIIGYHESPTRALKEKTKSSIAVGFYMLSEGKIDAFMSAGNTGAMLVGTMYSIKTIEGVLRPTIPTIIPKLNGGNGLLLDVGLNADCKPEHLNQFALLGSLYSQHILSINEPKIGLINVGEEEGKGNNLSQATYPLLKENTQINFVGNVEGRDLFNDKADVMVCDGFTGNIILKLAESFYDIAKSRGVHEDPYFKRFHYEDYGGTPVLGVSKPVIIGHGISTAVAFQNMMHIAIQMVETDLCNKIQSSFSTL